MHSNPFCQRKQNQIKRLNSSTIPHVFDLFCLMWYPFPTGEFHSFTQGMGMGVAGMIWLLLPFPRLLYPQVDGIIPSTYHPHIIPFPLDGTIIPSHSLHLKHPQVFLQVMIVRVPEPRFVATSQSSWAWDPPIHHAWQWGMVPIPLKWWYPLVN